MPEFAVQTRRLGKSYQAGDQELAVLRNVDLDIRRGEYVSIMGPSGSGKSTLLNLIGLLDVPTTGGIRLLGRETHALNANGRAGARRQALGFIFQSFNLMPRMSALHNVMLPMAIAGVPRAERRRRARKLLTDVGLADRMAHRPSELSGGQKQRVAIARALALDPPILLCDEPTGNLDSKTSAEIMGLFSRLHASGRTIIQVTHDEEMAQYSNRILHFRDGRIVSEERPRSPTKAPGPKTPLGEEPKAKETKFVAEPPADPAAVPRAKEPKAKPKEATHRRPKKGAS